MRVVRSAVVVLVAALVWPSIGAAAEAALALGLPEVVDPAALFVIYLHGRIIEEQGVQAVSPEHGPYRFQAILDAIAARGFVVIGDVRPRATDAHDYARKVVQQIETLRARGVPASHITVVGASKGGGIAALVSSLVGDSGVNTVLLAICNPEVDESWKRDGVCLKGHVLALYDHKDSVASLCRSVFERCDATLRDHGEIVLAEGSGHGILYEPLPEWIEPAAGWARAHAGDATRRIPAAPSSPAADDGRVVRAQARLQILLAEHGWPGATLAWVLPDGRVESVAAGVTDVPDGRPMKVGDRIFSGSIGKTYVAAVMLQLVAEGQAGLDDPVSRWLGSEPWFGRVPNASALTLRMLLAHTSGIPEHIQMPAFQDALAAEPFRVWKPAEMVAYVLDARPLFPAGSSFSYADTNYILVGMVIERITGLTYYGMLDERVLRPLGLRDTTPSDRSDLPGLVCGHTTPDNPFRVPNRTLVDGRYPMNPQVEWTGGGLITTAADLARWARALYAGEVLPPALRETMLQTGPSNLGEGVRYGLGVITWEGRHGQVWGHSGWVPGYHSGMAYFPALRLAVACQVNSDVRRSGGIMRGFLDDVAAALVQVSPAP